MFNCKNTCDIWEKPPLTSNNPTIFKGMHLNHGVVFRIGECYFKLSLVVISVSSFFLVLFGRNTLSSY